MLHGKLSQLRDICNYKKFPCYGLWYKKGDKYFVTPEEIRSEKRAEQKERVKQLKEQMSAFMKFQAEGGK